MIHKIKEPIATMHKSSVNKAVLMVQVLGYIFGLIMIGVGVLIFCDAVYKMCG